MSGGSGGPVILRIAMDALKVSLNKSGSVKLWMVLIATHAIAGLGWLF